mgnify:CR=1 FL=1
MKSAVSKTLVLTVAALLSASVANAADSAAVKNAATVQSTATAAAGEQAQMRQPLPLSTARVQKNLGAEGLYVYDCNPRELYDISHVPGAVHINVKDWKKLLPKDKKNSYLIFYCVNRLCNVSWEISEATIKLGYENVYVMPDGIQGWIHNGHKYDGTGNSELERQKAIDAAAQAAARGEGNLTK